MLSVSLFISNSLHASSEDDLKKRYSKYVQAISDLNTDLALSILTPFSQNHKNIEQWKEIINEDSAPQEDKIHAVRLKKGNKVAIVVVRNTVNTIFGSKVSKYKQTWKLINKKWYRAYFEDKEIDDKVNEISFELEKFEYYWDFSSSIYRPEIKFQVRNKGHKEIKYLQFKVQFLEVGKNEIFAEASSYAISSSDLPLKKNFLSNLFFLKSSIGFNVGKLSKALQYLLIDKIKKQKNNIYPVLYYKIDYGSQWIVYKNYKSLIGMKKQDKKMPLLKNYGFKVSEINKYITDIDNTPNEICLKAYKEKIGDGAYCLGRQNTKVKTKMFKEASDLGHSVASNDYAMILDALNIPELSIKITKLIRFSAKKGIPHAQVSLGWWSMTGEHGISINYSDAYSWNIKGYNLGHSEGANNIGELYENGWGVKKDIKKAKSWYKKSSLMGNKQARERLNKL